MPAKIAYCTNVHAGADWAETRRNLQLYAPRVRELLNPRAPMGVGLWLSAQTARDLAQGDALDELSQWLDAAGLAPFTFNGFPYGNFHQPVVKHKVYDPTWWDHARLEYTQHLAEILHRLAPAAWQGSISTLPIAWREPTPTLQQLDQAARLLREMADYLYRFEEETGRLLYVCLEPEPGCILQLSSDVVDFFQTHLLAEGDEATVRRHIRVCHDVCHAVVMCESQRDVLEAYRGAGVEVGKVQISSAVVVDFDQIAASDRPAALAQLSSFAEDRYLHQTTIQHGDAPPHFCEDLPLALGGVADPRRVGGTWRVHFHVPVYLGEFGWMKTSRQAIVDCVASCEEFSDVEHFEVETYAWDVLPSELRQTDLASGIAHEMNWFAELAAQHLRGVGCGQ